MRCYARSAGLLSRRCPSHSTRPPRATPRVDPLVRPPSTRSATTVSGPTSEQVRQTRRGLPRSMRRWSTMPPSFLDLGVAPVLVDELAAGGITDPSPVQAATIPDALAGRDVCGRAPTGSGKTLAYGLPMLQRTRMSRQRPRSLVLVPTRELANQITDDLAPLAEASGLWITAIYGGLSMNRQIQALREGVDIVIATPGRLNDLLERGELSVAHVEVVVLDEADQMADMGFLPQVERILRQVEGEPQTLLF